MNRRRFLNKVPFPTPVQPSRDGLPESADCPGLKPSPLRRREVVKNVETCQVCWDLTGRIEVSKEQPQFFRVERYGRFGASFDTMIAEATLKDFR